MIGVYGGTFNPIHFGHLRTALEVKQSLHLSEILFVPCGQPPHKQTPCTLAAQRLAMLNCAIDEEPGFRIDSREIDRIEISYTVDTLNSIKHETGAQSICLIVGLDAFMNIPTWHRWKDLFEIAHLVVMRRPGTSLEFAEPLKSHVNNRQVSEITPLKQRQNGLIFFKSVTQLDISATRIRHVIQGGQSARYLLPDKVWAMIQKENLYQKTITEGCE